MVAGDRKPSGIEEKRQTVREAYLHCISWDKQPTISVAKKRTKRLNVFCKRLKKASFCATKTLENYYSTGSGKNLAENAINP